MGNEQYFYGLSRSRAKLEGLSFMDFEPTLTVLSYNLNQIMYLVQIWIAKN